MKRSMLIFVLLLAQPLSVVAQEDKFFDSDGVRIRYVEAGSGEPVVLAHGFTRTLEGGWMDTGVFDNLAEDYRVIAFDHRGHGKSDKPYEEGAYGAEMGQDIIRLLDHLGIDKAHIIGYSMGSIILGQLIVTNPERILTATLGARHPRNDWSPQEEARTQQLAEDTLVDEGLIQAGQDVEALAALLRGVRTQAVTDRELSEVQIPTLAVIGSEDPRLPRVKELDGLIPGIEIVVIDGATHSGQEGAYYRPEFIEAIRRHLKAN